MGAILGLDREAVESLCWDAAQPGEVLVPANFNSPGQVVISGHATAVKRALELGSERGAKRCLPLEVSGPFHSPLMEKVEEGLREALNQVSFQDLQRPVVANYTAEFYPSKEEITELLAKQVCHPVRWEDSVRTLRGFGIDQTIEVGPGRVLSGLVRKTDASIRIGNVEDIKSLDKLRAGQESA
jgi:[acyl-carrier-protein] S-malonyltransferase